VRVGPLIYLVAGRLKRIGSRRRLKPVSLTARSAAAAAAAASRRDFDALRTGGVWTRIGVGR